FVDFRVCQIELWHSPNERWSQRIRVLEELHEPLALNRAAFPAEVGRHVAAVTVDAMAADAGQVVHQLPGLACGFIVRFRSRCDLKRWRQAMGAFIQREQSGCE